MLVVAVWVDTRGGAGPQETRKEVSAVRKAGTARCVVAGYLEGRIIE